MVFKNTKCIIISVICSCNICQIWSYRI